MGARFPRLAHRVLRDVTAPSRRIHRCAHGRHRPALPAPRGRTRTVRSSGRSRSSCRWVHGEHLLAEGRKMAKSTGNVILVRDVAERGHDPLALRLFFLTGRYRQQMNLTWDALAGADRRLSRWRAKVAEWAESPSGAMCADYVQRLTAAFDDDLDTPAALVALSDLEKDTDIPPGSKFETFAWVDRV